MTCSSRILPKEIAAVWRGGISKVQVQMIRIDGDGAATGSVFPRYGDNAPSPVTGPRELVRAL